MDAFARLLAAAAVAAALAVATRGASAACVARDDAPAPPSSEDLCAIFGGSSCPSQWTQAGKDESTLGGKQPIPRTLKVPSVPNF